MRVGRGERQRHRTGEGIDRREDASAANRLEDRAGTPWENDNIDPQLYQRFVGLTKYGAEAYLCRITYKRLNIDPAKTKTDAFLKFVPSGVAAVAELQAKGFAYLKVG